MPTIYPFTAIVGQERMRRALVLNAVDPRIGGVLIRGERGTAKSTAARALAALLPKVKVVSGLPFWLRPRQPSTWCTECKERSAQDGPLPMRIPTDPIHQPACLGHRRPRGRHAGYRKSHPEGRAPFRAGVLAAANRGLLYIDEVNLLDDHVVDVLLDSAAMGMNIVEREGISFTHPARFILVGTMNPEEGDLRPQLLDRFALSVDIHGIRDARERVLIMERNLAFEADPNAFRQHLLAKEDELSTKIEQARKMVDKVTYTKRDLLSIAALTSSLNVDGHRADLVILKAARAQAAFDGRTAITDHDIALAAELALPHRIKRGPFQQMEVIARRAAGTHQQLESQTGDNPDQTPHEYESQEQGHERKKKR